MVAWFSSSLFLSLHFENSWQQELLAIEHLLYPECWGFYVEFLHLIITAITWGCFFLPHFLAETCIFLPLVLFRRWRGHSSKRDFLPNAWPALCFSKDWSDPPSEFFSSVCVILSLGLLFHSVQNFSFTLTILTWESPSPVFRLHHSNRSRLGHLRKKVHLWTRMIREN